MMLLGVGLFSHCGSFRPRWLRSKRKRTALTFSFSVEVPVGEELDAVDAIRESVTELVADWSRSCYVKMKREEKKKGEQL